MCSAPPTANGGGRPRTLAPYLPATRCSSSRQRRRLRVLRRGAGMIGRLTITAGHQCRHRPGPVRRRRGRPADRRGSGTRQCREVNALVGSRPGAPLIELVAADFAATTSINLLVAITGAPADVTVSGVPMPQSEPSGGLRAPSWRSRRSGSACGSIWRCTECWTPPCCSAVARPTMCWASPAAAARRDDHGRAGRCGSKTLRRRCRRSGARCGRCRSPSTGGFRSPTARPGPVRRQRRSLAPGHLQDRNEEQPHRAAAVGHRRRAAAETRTDGRGALPRGADRRRGGAAGDELLVLHRGRGVTAGYRCSPWSPGRAVPGGRPGPATPSSSSGCR